MKACWTCCDRGATGRCGWPCATRAIRAPTMPIWTPSMPCSAWATSTRRKRAAGVACSRIHAIPATAGMHAQLQAWRGFVDARAPPIEDETLRLEPLGHHHCADFAWQYWDPDIARLCCLPVFADDAAWHRWLDECWGYGDQRLYAVLHRDWGFVGSVSLTLHEDLGFFYYWIGSRFPGAGARDRRRCACFWPMPSTGTACVPATRRCSNTTRRRDARWRGWDSKPLDFPSRTAARRRTAVPAGAAAGALGQRGSLCAGCSNGWGSQTRVAVPHVPARMQV